MGEDTQGHVFEHDARLIERCILREKDDIPSTFALPLSKNASHSSFTNWRGRSRDVGGEMGTMWIPWMSSGAEPK